MGISDMPRGLYLLIAITAIVAPALHLLSDVMELGGNGFSRTLLVINYVAFLLIPFMTIGLFAIQVPRISAFGLVGAVIYAISFIYFAHTTLLSLEGAVADYAALWARLGWVYSLNGALMVVGGVLFGIASLWARVLSRVGIGVFIFGLILNLTFALLPVAEITQIAGSTLRNIGLIVVGIGMLPGLGDDIAR